MQYLGELRQNWRPLLAATIGMGSGLSITGTITSTLAPTVLAANHWSAADLSRVSSLAIFLSFVFPFIGRLADVLGVRRTALIGQISMPLTLLAYGLMRDNLAMYTAIFVFQSLFCVTTTATIYTRLAVQYVKQARGLALAIVASGPALSGLVMSPILNAYVEKNGWEASYIALAAFSAIAGLVTFLLIPSRSPDEELRVATPKRSAREDYPAILRTPAFWIIAAAMLLCNLPQTILQVQQKTLLLANGVTGTGAATMLMAVQFGMLIGRFLTGIALDRFKPYLVSFLMLATPSIGLFIFASGYNAPALLTFAMFCIGFAFGAEGDLVAFLVARQFGVKVYGSVMGLVTFAMSLSTASGAMLLGVILDRTGHFDLFLVIAGTSVLLGAALLLLLGRGRQPTAEEQAVEETVPHPGVQLTGQV
jgi:MFS family permease